MSNYIRTYAKNHYIFITVVTYKRNKILEKGVWQRRFYEHTIRNEDELHEYLNYIHYNPVKHGYTRNVKDWEFSSFHKFVNKEFYDVNWGSDIQIGGLVYD